MDTRNIYRLLRQKFLWHVLAGLQLAQRSVMPRMWPPSSITLTIYFQVPGSWPTPQKIKFAIFSAFDFVQRQRSLYFCGSSK